MTCSICILSYVLKGKVRCYFSKIEFLLKLVIFKVDCVLQTTIIKKLFTYVAQCAWCRKSSLIDLVLILLQVTFRERLNDFTHKAFDLKILIKKFHSNIVSKTSLRRRSYTGYVRAVLISDNSRARAQPFRITDEILIFGLAATIYAVLF